MKNFTRMSSFLTKEIIEVLRQPRLILSLIFGPFLILLLFGLGYRNEARPVRAIFVVQPNTPMAASIADYAPKISPQLIYVGQTPDEGAAKQSLAAGQVDLVVVAPPDATQTISNNKQAVFTMFHNEIDPAQVGYIEYLAQIMIQEVNRRVLSTATAQGQQEATDVQKDVSEARQNAAAMRQALQGGDVTSARASQRLMQGNVSSLALALGASASLLNSVESNAGSGTQQGAPSQAQDIGALLARIQSSPESTGEVQDKSSYTDEIIRLNQTEQDLATLEQRLAEFRSVSPDVLVSPFRSEIFGINRVAIDPTQFFTPAVIVLLLQHIIITVAGLSIVREQRSGTMELFRVSPVTSAQILTGKYLSYMVFGSLMAALLALLIAFGLKVPMLGSWINFAAVVLALLFASLGFGFFISLMANTESQAVQLAMIALLLAVFFSGFLLDLRYLWGPVKTISWLIPATYANIMLKDIMLRGYGINWMYLGAMIGIGLVMLLISWLLLRRRMATD